MAKLDLVDVWMITIKLSLHSNRRGPGFWKLNTSLLEEDGYVKQIKTAIKAVQEEYQEIGRASCRERV